ncbi:MAG: hypothetical protein IJB96_03820 [Lachnospira sp.]|nr:hypothetical protein [Lachnospira sp.]
MDENVFETIEQRIGYQFQNRDLLQQAFVRRSYSQENGGEDNEVLEFIGDKVLDLVVVKLLTEKYGYMLRDCNNYDPISDYDEFGCEKNEAELTEIKKLLVQKKTLAQRIDSLQLVPYLIVGNGDHATSQDSVKEDLFEAIIGAIAIDTNWNMSELQNAVEFMLNPDSILASDMHNNYVALIEKWSLQKCGHTPLYHIDENRYPRWYDGFKGTSQSINSYSESANEIKFHCLMNLGNNLPIFRGFGKSKQEARHKVCEVAYKELEKRGLLLSIRDEIANPNKDDAINQLQTLARRHYFSIPTYVFKQSYDKDGNPIWLCECHIKEKSNYFKATASSKKESKKAAAYDMLQYVLSGE